MLSTTFTEREENNCFSIIAQVMDYQSNCIFFHFTASKTSRSRAVSIFKISASVL